jgi:hypothetical protein
MCACSNESKSLARFSYERPGYHFSTVWYVGKPIFFSFEVVCVTTQKDYSCKLFGFRIIVWLLTTKLYSVSQLMKMLFMSKCQYHKLGAAEIIV